MQLENVHLYFNAGMKLMLMVTPHQKILKQIIYDILRKTEMLDNKLKMKLNIFLTMENLEYLNLKKEN